MNNLVINKNSIKRCVKIARVKSHVLAEVIGTLMVILGLLTIYLFFNTLGSPDAGLKTVIGMLLIVVLTILAQTTVLIKIYEKL